MKVFRLVAIIVALAIPTAAIANHVMSSDCSENCDPSSCPHPGCPMCHHHAK
jgi:hypothetical protein